MSKSWVVHKFGGTSVANAERYRAVAEIVRKAPGEGKAVVVSAMSGVTDALLDLVESACQRDENYLKSLESLKRRHEEAAEALLGASYRKTLLPIFESNFADIQEVLRGVWLVRNAALVTTELISGYGELWSAQLLQAYLHSQSIPSRWLDAREVLTVFPTDPSVTVDWETSKPRLQKWMETNPTPLIVVTGFIASTPEGIPTTLRRNGSDYSASIFGALLDASAITIWTDVDGVLTADPRLVPEAVVLDELTYHEATELAYFGAKVVHPSTMAPAIRKKIPIWIRNTFRPEIKGTCIRDVSAPSAFPVKGFSTIDEMALVNVEGTGMMGVPGIAQRLFGSLREVGVSVVVISQASSEHSICFAVRSSQARLAKETVERAFYAELREGQIQTVAVADNCSVLAMVGENMVKRPGVAGKLFTALGKAGVNIRAIAQGSSERNISAVIDGDDARRALRAVHSAFYLSRQTLSIGVIGPGLIGGTFLDQLNRELVRLKETAQIDLRVRGIYNSKKMILSDNALDLSNWRKTLETDGEPIDLSKFVEHVHAPHLPHAVLIDATANDFLPSKYAEWLTRGLHIVTPNKKGNAGSLASYREIREASRQANRHYLYATTVGAGLPVLNTLRDLVKTGDEILRIEGIFSGTLSYLFNTFTGDKKFSSIVTEARMKGFTEPDPRDDLSGTDVARKLVILAREMGYDLELSQIPVQSLVPSALRSGTPETYLQRLGEFDGEMEKEVVAAEKAGEVLRYVGVIEPGKKATVELKRFPKSHAFARLNASDNIVAFTTARYRNQPLIVQGPGAGPEVTAAGVFADVLRLVSFLGGG